MRIAVLGTGMVGKVLGAKLVAVGHTVMMGSRSRDNAGAAGWAHSAGAGASQGTFADAARFGEIVFNCTAGEASIEALRLAGAENLRGKILIDVANPLDFSKGMPPTLTICNTDSLGERIQAAFPETHVVKALNTVNCALMVDPSLAPGDHNLFMCGNNRDAKATVAGLIASALGWKRENILDLGDISSARGTEMMLPLWIRLWGAIGHPHFNVRVVVGLPPKA